MRTELTQEQLEARAAHQMTALLKEAARLGVTYDEFTAERMKETIIGADGTWIIRPCFQIESLARASSVRISISFPQTLTRRDRRASAEISWSSTDRTLAEATVAVSAYQRAIEFAAIAEAILNN